MTAIFRGRALWIAAAILWIGGVGAGLTALMRYDNRPGDSAVAPSTWPVASPIVRDTAGPTIVMLAHPRCDCTRASLTELAELMARARRRPRVYVVFIKPALAGDDWVDTQLWRDAEAIEGVRVVRDERGVEARRFGAKTSGQVIVFGQDGGLLYSGGTTGSRGKAGENLGRAAILAALDTGLPQKSAPVFGCSMFAPADLTAEEMTHRHDADR
jgi:hypothetical protein